MKTYRPVSRRRIVNKKRLGITIGIVAAVVVIVVLWFTVFSKMTQEEPEAQAPETFAQGVSVGGVDVSGMTMEQAGEAVAPVREQLLSADEIVFTVPDLKAKAMEQAEVTKASVGEEGGTEGEQEDNQPESTDTPEAEETSEPQEYRLSLSEAGLVVDVEAPLTQAMQYSNEQRAKEEEWDKQQKEAGNRGDNAQPYTFEAQDFPLERTVDETVLAQKIAQMSEEPGWYIEPVGESYKVKTYSSKENLTTHGEMVKVGAEDGYQVDNDLLMGMITTQLNEENYLAFEAPTKVIKYTDVGEPLGEIYRMGSYTTSFSGSSDDRMFNIWKISDKLNGVVFEPGEVFSVNDHVGDRNAENGWAEAMGIENGVFTPQYGGGICQVSTTMYNATLFAELEAKERQPHTIPSTYVDRGRDATISTGSPDFKVENPWDVPLYMIVSCDVPDRTVTVSIYGAVERDYKIEITTEMEWEEEKPAVEYVTNSAIGKYDVGKVKSGQGGSRYATYKQKVDEDGNAVGEKELLGYSTYPTIAPQWEVGSGIPLPATGTPTSEVEALAAKLKAENEPAATPTPPPTESAAPPVTSEPPAESTAPPAAVTDPPVEPEPTAPPEA